MMQRLVGLTVGEVAHRSGVPVSTLHFYEKNGLISGWRTAGNQRRFGRDVLRFVAIIKVAQRAGIPLKDIKTALSELPSGRSPTRADWARLTRSWSEMLDHRIEALSQLRDQFESCIGCGCLSLQDCPLRNPDDALSAQGAGPRILIDTVPTGEKAPG